MRTFSAKTFAAVLCTVASSAVAVEAKIPILGWHGIPSKLVTAERYAEARDMGMDILMQSAPDVTNALRLLDLAKDAGIRLCLSMDDVRNPDKCADTINALKGHPALALWNIVDEPQTHTFAKWGRIVSLVNEADSQHEAYVNIVGDLGLGYSNRYYGVAADYNEFLGKFLERVPVKTVSIDVYPLTSRDELPFGTSLRNGLSNVAVNEAWYNGLETVFAERKKRGLGFSGFALSTAHRNSKRPYMEPQVPHMMLQQNVNLAYGAKMLQFFVYWPVSNSFGNGRYEWQAQPFTENAPNLRTTIYDRVREVVRRIQARAFVFVGGDVVKVRHTGEEIPRGATRLADGDLPPWVTSLETPDGGAVVSHIQNGKFAYVAVVNRSPDTELTLKIGLADGVERIRDDGSVVDAACYCGEYWLEPGAMEVFRF